MKILNSRNNNRVPLYTVVPRDVPFSVGISSSDVCNFKCKYCNQSTVEGIKDARILSWDSFVLIADQLEDLLKNAKSKINIIRFVGNGEPTLNKKLPDMIREIRKRGISERIELTTNGSMLNQDFSKKLIDAGLTRILISIQGITNEKYKYVCGYDMNIDNLVADIKFFYEHRRQCKVLIKTLDIAIPTKIEQQEFVELFEPISDEITIEKVINACADVDYNDFMKEDVSSRSRFNYEFREKICCDTLFMYMNIHANGKVDCCGCKYPPHFIGNIYDKTLREIWHGENHINDMLKHLKGERCQIEDCRECSSINYYAHPLDNLDNYRTEIINKLKEIYSI